MIKLVIIDHLLFVTTSIVYWIHKINFPYICTLEKIENALQDNFIIKLNVNYIFIISNTNDTLN